MRKERYKELTDDILKSVEKALNSRGYRHARIEIPRENDERSIDILAWKENEDKKVHLKITLDTKDLKRQETLDLIGISATMESRPIIVSEFDRKVDLQDEVIYEKNSVPAVNISTLKKLLDGSRDLYILAKKGDFYVRINGEALRRMREKAGLSLGEVAEMLGVTRKTVYEYERSSFDINIDNAYELIKWFGEDITKPYELFKEDIGGRKIVPPPDNRVEREIIKLFEAKGMDYYHAKRTFVDLLAKLKERKVLVTVEHKRGTADILEKAEELSKLKSMKNTLKVIVAPKTKKRDAERICDEAFIISEDELAILRKLLEEKNSK